MTALCCAYIQQQSLLYLLDHIIFLPKPRYSSPSPLLALLAQTLGIRRGTLSSRLVGTARLRRGRLLCRRLRAGWGVVMSVADVAIPTACYSCLKLGMESLITYPRNPRSAAFTERQFPCWFKCLIVLIRLKESTYRDSINHAHEYQHCPGIMLSCSCNIILKFSFLYRRRCWRYFLEI